MSSPDDHVDATLRELDQLLADRERHTRTELLQAAAEGVMTIDVDKLDAVLAAYRHEWDAQRAWLRAALLAAFAGDLTLLDAKPQSRADDDRPESGWQRL